MANPVQTKKNAIGSGTSLTVTFDSSVTAGNLIAVGVYWLSSTVTLSSLTDGLSNSYTLLDNPTTGTTTNRAAMAYAKNITGGACTLTFTFSASVEAHAICVEIEGRDTVSPEDGHVMASEGIVDTSITSGDITTTVASDYIFGFAANVNTRTFTAGSGFVIQFSDTAVAFEDQVQVAAGNIAATFTISDVAHTITGIMAFKPAGGAITRNISTMRVPNVLIL